MWANIWCGKQRNVHKKIRMQRNAYDKWERYVHLTKCIDGNSRKKKGRDTKESDMIFTILSKIYAGPIIIKRPINIILYWKLLMYTTLKFNLKRKVSWIALLASLNISTKVYVFCLPSYVQYKAMEVFQTLWFACFEYVKTLKYFSLRFLVYAMMTKFATACWNLLGMLIL